MIQKSLIHMIFSEDYHTLPKILQKHYSLVPYTTGNVSFSGTVNVNIARIFNLVAPLFKIINGPPPFDQQNVPINIKFSSKHDSNQLFLRRSFYYKDRKIHNFNSKIIYLKDNIILECMKFNFTAKLIYSFQSDKIIINYGGYFLRIGKLLISLPLQWIIGEFYACQEQIDETKFMMSLQLRHRLFGQIYQFDGIFKIENADE